MSEINKSLSTLKPLEKAVVVGFSEENIPNKILEMGIVPGVLVEFKCRAPWGGPVFIEYGKERSSVMLRENEADYILVEQQK